MRFYRCRNGGYPVVMDVPVYDNGTALVAGAMVMRGAHGGTTNSYYIEAYVASANEALSALGVMQESVSATTAALVAATGFGYGKCIINDDAHYLAEYLQTTSHIIDATNASTSTTVTITSLEDNIDGGWIYATEKVTAGATSAGSLRFCTAAGSSTVTVSAITVDTTTDFIKILPVGHRLVSLSTCSTGIMSKAAAATSINLHVVENYIGKSGLIEALRVAKHEPLNGLPKDSTKFYSELCILSHALHIK